MLHRINHSKINKLTKVSGEKGILVNQQISWTTSKQVTVAISSQKVWNSDRLSHQLGNWPGGQKGKSTAHISAIQLLLYLYAQILGSQCMGEEENQCQREGESLGIRRNWGNFGYIQLPKWDREGLLFSFMPGD